MPRTVTLIRHTEVDVPKGTIYGHLDVPLLEEAYPARLSALLPKMPRGAQYVASPLSRAARLAQDLAQSCSGTVRLEACFKELSFGAWEGASWSTLDRAATEHWTQDIVNRAPPRSLEGVVGESLNDLAARVLPAWRDALAALDAPLVIVAHAGPLRVLQLNLEGRPLSDYGKTTWDFGEAKQFVV